MSSLLDDNTMTLVISRSGTIHVKSWFERTACGKRCWDNYNWEFGGSTNLRWIGRLAQRPSANRFCKGCARIYKAVNVDG